MKTHPTRLLFGVLFLLLLAALLLITEPPVSPVARAEPPGTPEPTPTPGAELTIVGGTPAEPGEFPWQVALLDPEGYQFCGGSLIGDEWVLTAAHCVENSLVGDFLPADIQVLVGSVNLIDLTQGQVVPVSMIMQHPAWKSNVETTDIALLRLAQKVDISDPHVGTIPLVSAAEADELTRPGIRAIATGWGITTPDLDDAPLDPQLYQVDLPIVDSDRCNLNVSDLPLGVDGAKFICAGEDGKNTCYGDSGGPLMVETDGHYTLIGVTSHGAKSGGCAEPGKHAAYVRVSSYLDWIAAATDSSLLPGLELEHTRGSPGSSFALTVTNTLSTTTPMTITVNDVPLDVVMVDAESSAPVVLETSAEMPLGTYKLRAQAGVPGVDAPISSPAVVLALADDAPQRTASAPGAHVTTLPRTIDPEGRTTLAISHPGGRPGSAFVITGSNLPNYSITLGVYVNTELIDIIAIDPSETDLVLTTDATAAEGLYRVSLHDPVNNVSLVTTFFLLDYKPLREAGLPDAPVVAIPPSLAPPALSISHAAGAPGSSFAITGRNFPPATSSLNIVVNGSFAQEVTVTPDGTFTLLVQTAEDASPGLYEVFVMDPASQLFWYTGFELAADAPLRRARAVADTPVIALPTDLLPPVVSSDHASGQPGSSFIISGTGFPKHTDRLDILVNDRLVDSVSINPDGSFSFALETPPDAGSGQYTVRVRQADWYLGGYTVLSLQDDAPLQQALDSVDFKVTMPATIEPDSNQVYLPLIEQ